MAFFSMFNGGCFTKAVWFNATHIGSSRVDGILEPPVSGPSPVIELKYVDEIGREHPRAYVLAVPVNAEGLPRAPFFVGRPAKSQAPSDSRAVVNIRTAHDPVDSKLAWRTKSEARLHVSALDPRSQRKMIPSPAPPGLYLPVHGVHVLPCRRGPDGRIELLSIVSREPLPDDVFFMVVPEYIDTDPFARVGAELLAVALTPVSLTADVLTFPLSVLYLFYAP